MGSSSQARDLGRDARKLPADSLDDGNCTEMQELHIALPVLRVLIRWHQGGAVAANVRVSLDGGAARTTGADGYVDFGPVARGRHAIALLPDLRTPREYVPRTDPVAIEYLIDDHDEECEVDQVRRIRLGHDLQVAANGVWLRWWLPRIVGSGVLHQGHSMWMSLTTSAGAVSFHGLDPGGAAIALVNDLHVPRVGDAAWWYCRVTGGGNATVRAELAEEAYSRVGQAHDANALIPWNFYFWSAAVVMAANANTPVAFLQAADARNARGRSPLELFDVHLNLQGNDRAFAWEIDAAHPDHNDLHGGANATWVGHCNMMGAASVVVAEPQAHVASTLDAEEMKLICAEWAGNHVTSTHVWSLDNYQFQHGRARTVVPSLLAVNAADPGWRAQRKTADRAVAGRAAAQFFAALRQYLGANGEPLLCDMRAAYNAQNVVATSSEVWNQALFLYRARYREHPDAAHGNDARDAQDLAMQVLVYANSDGQLPTNTFPATMQNDVITLGPVNWRRTYVFRLQFTNDGLPDANDATNEWVESKRGADEVYLPGYVAHITAVSRAAGAGDGNPKITTAHVEALGVAFSARYQPA